MAQREWDSFPPDSGLSVKAGCAGRGVFIETWGSNPDERSIFVQALRDIRPGEEITIDYIGCARIGTAARRRRATPREGLSLPL